MFNSGLLRFARNDGKKILINFFCLILFFIDRFLKYFFIHSNFSFNSQWLNLEIFKNSGIAFGFQLNLFIMYFLISLILLGLFFFLIKSYIKKNAIIILALTLIIFGAFSNLIDRFFYNNIIDFVDFLFFPVFNLADIMIVSGIGIIIIQNIKHKNLHFN
ncbi:MAG: signal peptidase II [Candidatus Kuenenbacteria bacterium]